jgi:two-component system response regulator FixJ
MHLTKAPSRQADPSGPARAGALFGRNPESRRSDACPAARSEADPDRPIVALIDDDEGARRSTSWFLEGEGYRVVPFASGAAFLDAKWPEGLACALLDLRMPGLSGLDVLRALSARAGAPPVLVLSGHADVADAVAAMKLNAIDVILKPYRPQRLLDAVERAAALRDRTQAALTVCRNARTAIEGLSQRQRQVLAGVVRGRANKLIAWDLGLSIRTVEAYRAQMLIKLGVRGTADAVRMALAAGISAQAPPAA